MKVKASWMALCVLVCSWGLVACGTGDGGGRVQSGSSVLSTAVVPVVSVSGEPTTGSAGGGSSVRSPEDVVYSTIPGVDGGDPITFKVPRPFSLDDYDFWQLHGEPLMMVEPSVTPSSLAEVGRSADVVVVARVRDVAQGSEEEEAATTLITIEDINDSSRQYTLEITRASVLGLTFEVVAEHPANGTFVFILNRNAQRTSISEFHCAHVWYCVFGVGDDGKVVSLRAESKSSLTSGMSALDDVVRAAGGLKN